MSGRRAAPSFALLLLVACTTTDGSAVAPPGGASSSGYGVFQSVYGVTAVVEATVVAHRGPIAVANEFGGTGYPERSEDSEQWTTPFGMPVIVLADIELVESIARSSEVDEMAEVVGAAASDGGLIEVLTPVGVYEAGQRYQLWLQPVREEVAAMTYLGFDIDGDLVVGLGVPDAETAFERLTAHTSRGMTHSLTALLRENYAAEAGAPPGELMEFVGWPDPSSEPSSEPLSESSEE